jgi:hypothetical protein
MAIDKDTLLDLLAEVDKALTKKMSIVAVGGTAMTLLDLKQSTIDIDFNALKDDVTELRRAFNSIPHGFRVDLFVEGMIFSQLLPDDYLEKCIPVKVKFAHIHLFALHPVDIVVTKIGRLNERDVEDIKSCVKKFKLARKDVEKRALQVVYVGREENYRINLRYALKEFF